MAKKHDPKSLRTDGYENSGHTDQHPVKINLTEDEILRYGQQYARNLRIVIPETKRRFDDAIDPLKERLDELQGDRDYLIGELAIDPDDETGYQNEEPEPEQAHELARVLAEIRGVDAQINMLKKESQVEIAKIDLENEILSLRLNLGYEMRDVTCSWWVNWDDGYKRLVRIDTGEVVLTKPLSPEERQMSLLEFEITDEVRADAALADAGGEA